MEFEENIKPIGKRYFVCVWVMIMTLQDLAQETFIIFGKNWKHLEMNPALGLGFSIASNNCLRQIEKKIGFKSKPCKHYRRKAQVIGTQIQFLYKCIAELPETDRIIISLELEEVKQAEIAKIVWLKQISE
jgi:RNA polymerase sigma-70 factor (ECF subfamily)